MPNRRSSISLVLVLAGAAACGSLLACSPPPAKVAEAPSAAPQASATSAARALDAGAPEGDDLRGFALPSTPAGRQLAWALEGLAKKGVVRTEADVAERFSPSFLEKVPAAMLVEVTRQLGERAAPIVLVRLEGEPSPTELTAVVRTGPGGHMRVRIATESGAPHRIEGLLFSPASDLDPQPASWDEVDAKLRGAAPSVSFLAAELSGDRCSPVHALDSARPLAIGSTFKLYVLAALAKDVEAGKRAWADKVTIREAMKSLPSGVLQDEAEGKAFPLQDVAEKMISISDNTATDHLLFTVGRTAVEAAVKASGHSRPAALAPFLSTREMFTFKLLLSPAEQKAYLAANVPARRKLLDTHAKRELAPALQAAEGWTTPRFIEEVEWVASADDLCKLATRLKGYADKPATAPVGAILSKNPGVPDPAKAFKYIGFKGGSEPGVLNVTWLLERARDGKWLVMTATFNDKSSAIDEGKAIAAAASARTFLGK